LLIHCVNGKNGLTASITPWHNITADIYTFWVIEPFKAFRVKNLSSMHHRVLLIMAVRQCKWCMGLTQWFLIYSPNHCVW